MIYQSPSEMTINITNINVENLATMATQTAEPDLVNRMRRLSAGSTESSFSVISDNPSVRSLDTNGSVNGGISVEPPSIKVLEICLEALTVADRVSKSIIDHGNSTDIAESMPSSTNTGASTPCTTDAAESTPDTTEQPQQPDTISKETPTPEPSPYWLQFSGFVPAPTATFRDELARLAKHENWSNKTKRKQQVKALSAEITHHYGTCKDKLDRWQQLCEDVGIDVVPKSITQCRKVSLHAGCFLWLNEANIV
jgi:hypothetical protein